MLWSSHHLGRGTHRGCDPSPVEIAAGVYGPFVSHISALDPQSAAARIDPYLAELVDAVCRLMTRDEVRATMWGVADLLRDSRRPDTRDDGSANLGGEAVGRHARMGRATVQHIRSVVIPAELAAGPLLGGHDPANSRDLQLATQYPWIGKYAANAWAEAARCRYHCLVVAPAWRTFSDHIAALAADQPLAKAG